jgi:tetratricopeptide (TPR) repeat protein
MAQNLQFSAALAGSFPDGASRDGALSGGLLRWVGPALLLVLLGVPALAKDTIIPVTGRPTRDVDIVSETYKEVVYRLAGVPSDQRMSAERVKEIRHDDTPEAFTKALEAKSRGEYENAIQSFRLAIEKGKRPWVQEYSLFEIAECYQLWGQADSSKYTRAVESYKELKNRFPQSRFVPQADIDLGKSLTGAGDYAQAEQHFTALENTARDAYGIIWEIEAKLGGANNLEVQAKYGEARSKYTSISNAARGEIRRIPSGDAAAQVKAAILQKLADEARLREGICFIRAGSYSEARTFYDGMISEGLRNKDSKGLGGAYNGRGEAFFQLKEYMKALQDFAQASTVYFNDSDETARALYFTGLTIETMEGKASSRSKSYFEEVAKFFPGTKWATMAKVKM